MSIIKSNIDVFSFMDICLPDIYKIGYNLTIGYDCDDTSINFLSKDNYDYVMILYDNIEQTYEALSIIIEDIRTQRVETILYYLIFVLIRKFAYEGNPIKKSDDLVKLFAVIATLYFVDDEYKFNAWIKGLNIDPSNELWELVSNDFNELCKIINIKFNEI